MKSRQETEARSIAEQAAEWLLILEDEQQQDREAFADWLARSPLHVGAFLRASAVDSLLNEFGREERIEIDTALFKDELADVVPMERATAEQKDEAKSANRKRFWLMRPLALAATVAALAIAVGAPLLIHRFSQDSWKHYVTAVGEQRALTLEDGSVVFMGPDSKVDVLFDTDQRKLRLESGQAVFRAHHDPTRPFVVHSGRTVVQAVGTEFDVRRVHDASVVSVIEGAVQVSHERTIVQKALAVSELQPVRLTAGQELRVSVDGQAAAPGTATVDQLQAWKERRLTFVNETLFTIAEELNRYNRSPKIRIEDQAAGEERYAAAFDADDPESLVVVLERDPRLSVTRDKDVIVIRAR